MIPAQPARPVSLLVRGIGAEDEAELKAFVDFVERGLTLDPKKRMTPEEALRHPFIKQSTK